MSIKSMLSTKSKFIVQSCLLVVALSLISMQYAEAFSFGQNLEQRRANTLANLSDDEMIVYETEKEQIGTIYVFSSVDCRFCLQFHKEIPRLNDYGITVKYLAFPLKAKGTEDYARMVSVWNNPDRKAAWEQGTKTLNAEVDMSYANESDSVINKHLLIGVDMQVRGTPAIFFEDGTMMRGAIPAGTIARHFNN